MNRINTLNEYLLDEFQVGKLKLRAIDILFFAFITFIAVAARYSLFEYKSGDYNSFLHPWFSKLDLLGGFAGLSESLGDYTPPYLYILAFLTYLPIDSLITIKLVSCIFDFVTAFIFMRIVYRETRSLQKGMLAYFVLLFAPTVLFNGALWAQCDIIFTMFCLLSVYYFTKDDPTRAAVYFSIAFCFKLQAVFIAPLLIFMWLKGRMKLRHFLFIPAIYLISVIPAFIAGRPLGELLTIYVSQSGQYKRLSLNAPNIYIWMNDSAGEYLSLAAILLCAASIVLIIYMSYKIELTNNLIYSFALLFALVVPFLLPHMHERYFFMADLFSIIYAFIFPKRVWIAVGVSLCSLACYSPYLFANEAIPLPYVAVAMLVIIIGLVKYIRLDVEESESELKAG